MAKLLSVNVGLPRDIEWQGRTVRTAVWKEAVSGRRRVRRLNIDGDGQGDLIGHGGEQRAVFVYQIETFCPYKGLASYYDVGQNKRAAWSYVEPWPEVTRVSGFVSFEPDVLDVYLDGRKLALEPGQAVISHGIDRGLDPDEIRQRGVATDAVRALPSSRPSRHPVGN